MLDGLSVPDILEYLLWTCVHDAEMRVYVSSILLNITLVVSGLVAEADWLFKERGSGGLMDGDVSLLARDANLYAIWVGVKEGVSSLSGVQALVDEIKRSDDEIVVQNVTRFWDILTLPIPDQAKENPKLVLKLGDLSNMVIPTGNDSDVCFV